MALGLLFGRDILVLLGTREELLEGACLYFRICLLGIPAAALYNHGRAVCSAMGETRKPFLFLLAAGVLNLALNLLFVIRFGMDIVGVALATVISQYGSAVLVTMFLARHRGVCRLTLSGLRFHREHARDVFTLGLSGGVQEAAFAVSNLFLQRGINSFDAATVAGHAIALNADAIMFSVMGGFWTACASFMSQNFGAGNRTRFLKTYRLCLQYTFVIGAAFGALFIVFRYPFLSLFSPDRGIVEAGTTRIIMLGCFYPFCVLQDCTTSALHSMGKKIVPLIIGLTGICAFRIIWIHTVFAYYHTLPSLYALYIFSFLICGLALLFYFLRCERRYWISREEVAPGSGA